MTLRADISLRTSLAGLFGLFLSGAAAGAPLLQSPVTRTPMLELYTSEGCSSCPPAERWLAQLRDAPGLWRDVIPVNLHVDYWDNLGWRDPYAKRAYSDRQYQYQRLGRAGAVYTPGFIYAGEEWRGWFERESLPASAPEKVGILSVEPSGEGFAMQFAATDAGKPRLTAHLAVLGFGVKIPVSAGENAGRELVHNFVVEDEVQADASAEGNRYRWQLPRPAAGTGGERHALVAWVTRPGDPAPLQAVAGWWDAR